MEKAILVGLDLGTDSDFFASLAELKNLAEACDVEVVGQVTQKADAPTANFYIGQGKVAEIKQEINVLDANLLIFDDELSPSHIRNLEQALEIKIIDRTVLILDIFAKRAKTKEAILQVELAQAEYYLPRVAGMYKSLSRQKSGTGSKGPGEQQLELDKRIIRNRVHKLKTELNELVAVRRTQRHKRSTSNVPTVAIVGYTNSGKSTLMNALMSHAEKKSDKYVFEKDMLFATLETQTREIKRDNNHDFLVTDTVGFISKLPHQLIEAFKSTLEETTEASLILHVIDASNPRHYEQAKITETVLEELGAKNIPIIHVINKMDLCPEIPANGFSNPVYVSALKDENLDRLLDMIDKTLFGNRHLVKLFLPFDKGGIYSELQENAFIKSTEYTPDGISVLVELSEALYKKYQEYIA
ncbi:MAG TPA: GTPase HflX [Bacillota bacterium]|nr:GTPase HflX [Bacillota bacterium]HPF42077.1 GTPase HflX [Bacillota bacterium]HPJ85799.1 GTPase HflX [Bacillota bacterium]HPQ61524.1 GTPase HflX [Bacillota bacterium]HRX91335.1 GTPase HflX [Candidatus Izemoplasmatales bacterium]